MALLEEEEDKVYDEAYAKAKQAFAGEAPEEEIKRDYTFRKKVIFKGKMAPPGFVYLVVDKKLFKDQKFTSARMIHGKLATRYQEAILSELRESIKEKYGI
jgi:hypothetical protein